MLTSRRPQSADLSSSSKLMLKYLQRHQARKLQKIAKDKYHIEALPQAKLSAYKNSLLGNDPVIHDIKRYRDNYSQIAVVGTAYLRSILLACELSNPGMLPPKVFIVDNSVHIQAFWKILKKYAKTHQTKQLFMQYIADFIIEITPHVEVGGPKTMSVHKKNKDVFYEPQDAIAAFEYLFSRFRFKSVIDAILNTEMIIQSWNNNKTISVIKNIIDFHKIPATYVYASNLIAMYGDKVARNILTNIQQLNPKLVIHTDCSSQLHYPERVYLTEDSSPEVILKYLKPYSFFKQDAGQLSRMQILLLSLITLNLVILIEKNSVPVTACKTISLISLVLLLAAACKYGDAQHAMTATEDPMIFIPAHKP